MSRSFVDSAPKSRTTDDVLISAPDKFMGEVPICTGLPFVAHRNNVRRILIQFEAVGLHPFTDLVNAVTQLISEKLAIFMLSTKLLLGVVSVEMRQ